MCDAANALRLAWYATATQIPTTDPPDWDVINADRAKPEYQRAFGDYIQHRRGCETCKREITSLADDPGKREIRAGLGQLKARLERE